MNNVNRRMSLKEYGIYCLRELRTHWKKIVLPVLAVLFMQLFVRLDINYTESLPHHAYLTFKGSHWKLERGDYAAFAFPTEHPVSPFRKGDHMMKIVIGVPGDTVVVNQDRSIQILSSDSPGEALMGGIRAGIAKAHSKSGRPLNHIEGGQIPAGRYYMYAPHRDSLDSRYEIVGLIGQQDILGYSIPLF